MRVLMTFLVMLSLTSLSWGAHEQGVDYEVLKNIQPAPSDGKVEVLEFFSYGCPHCYHLEPYIRDWVKNKADDVEVVQVPAVFNKNWEAFAKLYYTAEVLGVKDKMHPIIFDAMHGEGKKIRSMEQLKGLFEKNGISAEEFNKALNSFSVETKTRRAKTMTQDYAITSVPNIIVQGKYLTNSTLARDHANVFGVVDFLINKVKEENK